MKPQDCERLTLFPGASRDCASPFLAQEKGAESWTTAICGPKCSGLSPNLRRVGLSLKTYLESCGLPLPTLSRTWKVQAITSSCLCMKLRLSARRTAAPASPSSPTEPQLWATPNTMDHLPQRSPEALIRQATTTRKGRTRPANLREQPGNGADVADTDRSRFVHRSFEIEPAEGGEYAQRQSFQRGENVADPDLARLQRRECGSVPERTGERAFGARGASGSIADDPDRIRRCRDARRRQFAQLADGRWWAVEPDVGRVAHGVSNRVHRIKALGNAVVPMQFYPIFKAIWEVEHENRLT